MSESNASFNSIPPKALAHIVAFLPVETIAAYTAANRRLRFDVAPLVTEMTVTRVAQMSPAFAKRFENMESLTFFADNSIIIENAGFTSHLIPFLSAFTNLTRVDFADAVKLALGLLLQVPEERGQTFGRHDWEKRGNPMGTAIHLLCEAFRSDELPGELKVEGLFCPWPLGQGQDHTSSCILCRHVISSFPFQHLLGRDENGVPMLTFLDLNGVLTKRREIDDLMKVLLFERLEKIALSPEGEILQTPGPFRDAGLILHEVTGDA